MLQSDIMPKYLKITLVSISSILLLLVATLAVHIYMVTPKNQPATANWQLGRITFEPNMSDSLVTIANREMRSISGIKQVVINAEQGNLVFAYTPSDDLNNASIFEKFNKNQQFNAELFIPSEKQLAQSCPVIDKSSITYRLGAFFQNIFN